MAIISTGYEGEIDETAWAEMLPMMGGRIYGVKSVNDWRATIGSADRSVVIGTGVGFGHGVRDTVTAPVTVSLPAATTGSRWDLICARRNWNAPATAFGSIQGTTAALLPARKNLPGEEDDQPLYLAKVEAGKSQVAELIDLRVWGGLGGATARSELVHQYLPLGSSVLINGVDWQRTFDADGNSIWLRKTAPVGYQAAGIGVAGIAVPGTSGTGSLLVKTGILTDSGSLEYGNQYLTAVRFDTEFPNQLLSVQVTQIQQDGAYAGRSVAVDGAHRGGFRVMYPGENSATKRSVLWVAFGI